MNNEPQSGSDHEGGGPAPVGRRAVMVRLTDVEYEALRVAARMDDRAMGYVARNFIRTGLGLAGTAPGRTGPAQNGGIDRG